MTRGELSQLALRIRAIDRDLARKRIAIKVTQEEWDECQKIDTQSLPFTACGAPYTSGDRTTICGVELMLVK